MPADGYCVQLGRMEPPKCRGTILATGQIVRFSFSIFARLIQTFFLNGKSTSPEDTQDITNYWSFGLSMNGYYALLLFLIVILEFPIIYLEEMKDTTVKDKSKTTLSSMDLTCSTRRREWIGHIYSRFRS